MIILVDDEPLDLMDLGGFRMFSPNSQTNQLALTEAPQHLWQRLRAVLLARAVYLDILWMEQFGTCCDTSIKWNSFSY